MWSRRLQHKYRDIYSDIFESPVKEKRDAPQRIPQFVLKLVLLGLAEQREQQHRDHGAAELSNHEPAGLT